MDFETPKLIYDVVVIGGGAAGTMAAITAARNGARVAVVEKNQSIGRKLCITGKGRCNITNACDMDELIANVPENGRFMYSSLSQFSNYDIIDFFESIGVKTVVERGNRVFPASQNAKDVKEALLRELKKLNVKIYYGTKVTAIITENGFVKGVKLSENEMVLYSEKVILATGGKSYPLTGSTGDGYGFAEKLGHTVTPLKPCLVGVKTREKFTSAMAGLTLKNVGVSFYHGNKNIYNDFGELLFTHTGVSGPVVLSASFELAKYDYNDVKLIIDLKHALTEEQLLARIDRDFEKFARKIFANSLDELLPKSMVPVIVKLSGIDPDKNVSQISKEERKALARLLKNFELNIVDSCPFDEAIVTLGGVKTSEINPKTMESKIIGGLYIVGELLGVTAYTGGFNLTVAFSTGFAAGKDAAEKF